MLIKLRKKELKTSKKDSISQIEPSLYPVPMAGDISLEELQSLIRRGLERSGMSALKASMAASGNGQAIANLMSGKMPSVERWASFARVLNISFSTGFEEDGLIFSPENSEIAHLNQILDYALERSGYTARKASMIATGSYEAIRSIRDGSFPRLDRWQSICRVLDIPFHTGLTDSDQPLPVVAMLVDGQIIERATCLETDWPVRPRGDLFCIEVGEGGHGVWQKGDLLFFDRADPLADQPGQLIGKICLVESDSGEKRIGRCRLPEKGEHGVITLEDIADRNIHTCLMPLKILPLRLVLPLV